MVIRYLSLAISLGLGVSFPPQTSAQSSSNTHQLDKIVVTATRTPIAVEDSLIPVEIIDRVSIENSQASSLTSLLKGRAGIDISNQGGAGKLSTISLRGTEAGHVLVLIDGVRAGSATAGLMAFQDIPLEQIERIEIVRGSRSSLYGSEAIGGVIQLFTRNAGKGLQQQFHLGMGSQQKREASAGFSYRGDSGWLSTFANFQKTAGINSCRGTAQNGGAGCFVDEPDRDGYRNLSWQLRGGWDWGNDWITEGSFLTAQGRNQFDGGQYSGNESDILQQIVSLQVNYQPVDQWNLKTQWGRSIDESKDFYKPIDKERKPVSRFKTQRDSASIQANIPLNKEHLLTVGGDWQNDNVSSTTLFTNTSRNNWAGFAEYQGEYQRYRWEASIRHDNNQQFGSYNTGGMGFGYQLPNNIMLTSHYSTGFKAPTFNDLYYPNFSNSELQPEESKSINLGIQQSFTNTKSDIYYQWGFNLYQTNIENLISYDAALGVPNNINKARIQGAEITLNTQLFGWDINTQISRLNPRNRSLGSNYGNYLARRSQQIGRIDIDKTIQKWGLGTTFFSTSHRYDNAANKVRLAGYSTVDLRVNYQIDSRWKLQAGVNNVFNKEYESIAWYNQVGREYSVSLRYNTR